MVEVERLEWGEQTDFRGDFCEAILGQICKEKEQELINYVNCEHQETLESFQELFHYVFFGHQAVGLKTNQYISRTEVWAVQVFIKDWSKITPGLWPRRFKCYWQFNISNIDFTGSGTAMLLDLYERMESARSDSSSFLLAVREYVEKDSL